MVRITISGHQMEVTDNLKAYATEKAQKLQRYYDRVHAVDIVFDIEASKHRCEVIVKADRHEVFVAKEHQEDSFAALDVALKDLERQLKRQKEKFRNRKHAAGRPGNEPPAGFPPEESSTNTLSEGEAP